jgi:electron transport complex protein RnfC
MTFPGGVHPKEYKNITADAPIEQFKLPTQLAIMLSQHIGAVCKPTVAKGDKVTAGQVVGSSDSFVSAPVHSPVNGTVKDIALRSHPVLGREKAVIIDTEAGENIKLPQPGSFDTDFKVDNYQSQQIVNAVKDAGIVGMGGAGFPTHVKLAADPNKRKEIMIINACECEPFITCDYRLMRDWTYQLIAGIKLAAKAANCFKVRIGIEDNKPKAIKALKNALQKSKTSSGIEVVPVKTKYPQGGERQLIRALTGRNVPTGGIPPMIGAVVLNVATCAAIAEAAVYNTPLTHRIITVTGSGVEKTGNFYVPVGTSVNELLEFCGGLKKSAKRIILGGPMMGLAIADLDTPITKTTGAVTVLTSKELPTPRETACIRCGRCVAACPENLNPTKIAHAVKNRKMDMAENYFLNACIECGSCSYVCPANIELTGYIKTGKIQKAREKKQMPK